MEQDKCCCCLSIYAGVWIIGILEILGLFSTIVNSIRVHAFLGLTGIFSLVFVLMFLPMMLRTNSEVT